MKDIYIGGIFRLINGTEETKNQVILSSQKLESWLKLEISIFIFIVCHYRKGAGTKSVPMFL